LLFGSGYELQYHPDPCWAWRLQPLH
jgi:hypothetical protein